MVEECIVSILFVFYQFNCFVEDLVEDICKLPKNPGPCEGSQVYWYYNDEKKSCREFTYGGCGGNKNRFRSQSECIANCYSELLIKGTLLEPKRL